MSIRSAKLISLKSWLRFRGETFVEFVGTDTTSKNIGGIRKMGDGIVSHV